MAIPSFEMGRVGLAIYIRIENIKSFKDGGEIRRSGEPCKAARLSKAVAKTDGYLWNDQRRGGWIQG